MTITRFDPFSDLFSLRRSMDRLFDDFASPLVWRTYDGETISPMVDVHQTADELIVTANLPGVHPEDVDITVTGQTLLIKGEFKADEEVEREQFLYRERRFGSFTRQIQLPVRVQGEKAEATYHNGVLRLAIPKAEEVKPKQISIKVDEEPVKA